MMIGYRWAAPTRSTPTVEGRSREDIRATLERKGLSHVFDADELFDAQMLSWRMARRELWRRRAFLVGVGIWAALVTTLLLRIFF